MYNFPENSTLYANIFKKTLDNVVVKEYSVSEKAT